MNNQLENKSANKRLLSLDAFRGFTVAAMIIVNTPGSWEWIYAPLRHAQWNGITPTDLVFPFFIFIVGVSVVLALNKSKQTLDSKTPLVKKIIRRSIIIFALGVLLNLIGSQFTDFRLPGVLQRIAIVFCVTSLLFLFTTKKTQLYTGLGLIAGYWLIMFLIPVPQWGAGVIEPGKNLAAWIDQLLIPGKMYGGNWDPEGVLSTLPATATGIAGMMSGYVLISNNQAIEKIGQLFVIGFLLTIAGSVCHWFFPINKNIWSSSYVLFTAGLATSTLATIYWIVDYKGYQPWAKVGIIFGSNAITAYVLHYIMLLPFVLFTLGNNSLQGHFMSSLIDAGLAPQFASLLWALSFTSLVFLPVWWLYKKKIFLKI